MNISSNNLTLAALQIAVAYVFCDVADDEAESIVEALASDVISHIVWQPFEDYTSEDLLSTVIDLRDSIVERVRSLASGV